MSTKVFKKTKSVTHDQEVWTSDGSNSHVITCDINVDMYRINVLKVETYEHYSCFVLAVIVKWHNAVDNPTNST